MELSNKTWYLPLVEVLSNYYKEPIQHQPALGISVMLGNSDLGLYIRLLENYKLTIARISVGEEYERKGIGSKILEWCIDFCKENSIQKVVIESALTEASVAFCKKHRMKQDPNSIFDWFIKVND